MNVPSADLPAAGVVRVIGPREAGTGFLVAASGLIVTCAHVLAGSAPGDSVSVEPHVARQSWPATVELLQNPPDVAVLRLAAPVPPEMLVLPLGRSPRTPQPGLRTFGYPQLRPEAGLPGELAFNGVTAADGYDQLALRSEEATLGFSGSPIWDPELGAVVGMVKSIARGDPGQRLSTAAIGVPAEVIRDICPELRLPAGCPYRGLEPFTEEHVDYYYGREHATRQLLASLAARDFVPVVAVSGGGKSSLLQAGLAKGLRDRKVVGLAQRIRCYLRVSGRPHTGLLHSLAQHGVILPPELAAAPPQQLAAAVHSAVPVTDMIMVVDQFERLYTDCEDAAERERFLELLRYLATDAVKVVIGLRADFYHLALADLGERLAAGQVALAPMSEQELGQAITAPAGKLLRSFQPGLIEQLSADVRGRPGDLPLLQFALTELWERDAAGGVLTEETYRSLGVDLPDGTHLPGAQGALIGQAEMLWQDLDPADRPRLQRILLGLIAAEPAETGAAGLSSGTRDLSRPARLAQWDDEDQRLIQRLVEARLLTADRAAAGGQPIVEVSHEALLRAWPRLRKWLEERSQFVVWRAQDLAPNLERWLDGNQNPEFLLPRSLLEPALRWLHDYPDELAGPPARYIEASKQHRVRRRRLISSAVTVLVVASLAAAGIFYSLRETAVQRQNIAASRLLVIESETLSNSDPVLSKLLSVAAWRINPSTDARYAMLAAAASPGIAALPVSTRPVHAVAFSPDGAMLATGGDDGAWLWNTATRRPIGGPLTDLAVFSAAFSPDGTMLAIGSTDGRVLLWNVATRRQIGLLSVSPGTVLSVAFSRDGAMLATGSDDGTARLWNVSTRQQIGATLTIPARGGSSVMVESVAFSPDGAMLATGSTDGKARLWDVATHRQIGPPIADDGTVWSVAFNWNGGILAAGSADGTARLWDTDSHRQIGAPLLVGSPVQSVAFSPDGTMLATGSDDGAVRVWDVDNGTDTATFTGSASRVWSVAFNRAGTMLATGADDGVVRLWQPPTYRQIGGPLAGTGSGDSVAFSRTGTMLATGGDLDAIRLWDVASHRQAGAPLAVPGGVESVAFSPGGGMLATGSTDGTARLWDVASHRQIGAPLKSAGTVDAVAFSPDGAMLATGSTDGAARLWDVATHRQIGSPFSAAGTVWSVAFSPDGAMLATGGPNGRVRLWNVATHRQIGAPLAVPASSVYSVAFSPDGAMLAAGGDDDTWLWDVATHRQDGGPLTVPESVTSVTFSPDGEILATGSTDGVRLWDVATRRQVGNPLIATNPVAFSLDGRLLATGSTNGVQLWNVADLADIVPQLCASAGQSLTRSEWAQYASGTAYQNVCS